MKLYEIAPIKQVKNLTDAKFASRFSGCKLLKRIGAGVQAIVYQHKSVQRQNSVIKVVHLFRGLEDPYIKFVEQLIKNEGNPYLPKIYSVRIYECENHYDERKNTLTAVIEMERLYSLRDMVMDKNLISERQLIDLFRRGGFDVDEWADIHLKIYTGLSSDNKIRNLAYETSDEQLSKALNIIADIVQKTRSATDFHTGNWMIRLTSTGPQLVITDPVVS